MHTYSYEWSLLLWSLRVDTCNLLPNHNLYTPANIFSNLWALILAGRLLLSHSNFECTVVRCDMSHRSKMRANVTVNTPWANIICSACIIGVLQKCLGWWWWWFFFLLRESTSTTSTPKLPKCLVTRYELCYQDILCSAVNWVNSSITTKPITKPPSKGNFKSIY